MEKSDVGRAMRKRRAEARRQIMLILQELRLEFHISPSHTRSHRVEPQPCLHEGACSGAAETEVRQASPMNELREETGSAQILCFM